MGPCLSAAVGRICAPVSLFIPAYMIAVMCGWSGLRGVLPAVAFCGIAFAESRGVAERYPAWSPDGKSVAFFSDRSGEYELTLFDAAPAPMPGQRRQPADRKLVSVPESGEAQVTLSFNQPTPSQ